MDVVAFVLDVGDFHQECCGLDAVVERLSAIEAASPSEAEILQVGFDFFHGGIREFLAVTFGILGDKGEQCLLLSICHFRGGDANGIELVNFSRRTREDVSGRFFRENDGLSIFREGGGEGACEIFFCSEGAGAIHRVVGFDLGGIGGEEGGREGGGFAVDDGVVEGEVMSLEAPTPGASGGGFTEYGGEIGFWVAEFGAFFDFSEEGFESDDGIDLGQAWIAEGGLEEVANEGGLFFGECLERNSVSLGRDEVPVFSFFWGEGKTCLFRIGFVKRGEEGVGGASHFCGDFFEPGGLLCANRKEG